MYFALYNGGPQTFAWSILIVLCGAIAQAASIGEMASIQPIAGAQYHWTWHLAPARVRRIATWMQAWITWFGYVSLLAGIANVTIILLESLVALNNPTYAAAGWHTSVLVIAMCVFQGAMNMYAFKLIPGSKWLLASSTSASLWFLLWSYQLWALGTVPDSFSLTAISPQAGLTHSLRGT